MLLSALSFDADSLGKRMPREASLPRPETSTQLALPKAESLPITHPSTSEQALG